MTYTIDSVPAAVAAALQRRAVAEGKPVEGVILDILQRTLSEQEVSLGDSTDRAADDQVLDEIAGSWEDDPAFDEAVAEFGQVDEGIWK